MRTRSRPFATPTRSWYWVPRTHGVSSHQPTITNVNRIFAKYAAREPSVSHTVASHSVHVRRLWLRDLESVAEILQERNGGRLEDHVERLSGALRPRSKHKNLHLVAAIRGKLVGYGRASYFDPPDDAPANVAPAGWYLTGVNVREEYRRLGVASELTQKRLEWLRTRADDVYYFANARNRASIDLHARLGFNEVTKDFWFPGVSFTGGVGILFRLRLGKQA